MLQTKTNFIEIEKDTDLPQRPSLQVSKSSQNKEDEIQIDPIQPEHNPLDNVKIESQVEQIKSNPSPLNLMES